MPTVSALRPVPAAGPDFHGIKCLWPNPRRRAHTKMAGAAYRPSHPQIRSGHTQKWQVRHIGPPTRKLDPERKMNILKNYYFDITKK
jgi:hypothetical protein